MSQHRKNFYARLLSGAAMLSLTAFAGAARAETVQYLIPAQPLDQALEAFGAQSGHPLLVDMSLVKSKKSPGFAATADPETALRKLLTGTGLSYKRNGEIFAIIVAQNDKPIIRTPAPPIAAAETVSGSAVEGLVVTAQKRRENIQDVPIAISAFTQDELTLSQIAGGPDLMTQVPNMTFTKTNFSSYSIQIRGIGTQAISATTDPAVAVAFNNTPFIRNHFFEQEFYDLERVEVLRGPQGTLYGRNATAGVVNVLSAKPSFIYETKASVDLANYSGRRIEGMANFPLDAEGKMAFRIAGAWTKRDGFVENTLTGQQTDGRDLWSTRASLRLDPNDFLSINLIYEHFEENDDRLRSGKQLCHSDPGPSEVNGIPVGQDASALSLSAFYVSQGCKAASLYGKESFDTPNGYALAYYGALGIIGSPVYLGLNPYASQLQSRDLRQIETHLEPAYEASADIVELQLSLNLPNNLSLSSETGFSRDSIFSFEDYNRFDTTPGVFIVNGRDGDRPDLVGPDGMFCDPQLGCTSRLAAGDLSTAKSQQFSQEFRLSSNFDGPFNFSLGANFLRYDNEDKYYVFINTITAWQAYVWGLTQAKAWEPGVTDASECIPGDYFGPVDSDPNKFYDIGCSYIDPNDIHHLNDQGRNYFLSRNPYHLLSYAAFGEAYYEITPELKLTAGLRWTVDRKTAPQIPSWLLAGPRPGQGGGPGRPEVGTYGNPVRKVIEQEWQEPTGRIALDWKPDLAFTDDTLVFGSYVRGYKAGGANPPPPVVVFAGVCPPECTDGSDKIVAASLAHPETFDAEYVDAFEVGTKNTFWDGRLTANLSAFYYDYRGYQISQIVDRSAVNLNFDATVKGLELEVDWQPLENLRFGFKGGYENTRLADGSQAIDLIDRTAGKEGWMVFRPFPTMPSNCVVPTWVITEATIPSGVCAAYIINIDPVTFLPYVPDPTESAFFDLPPGYPGYNPASANQGQGFFKDLSGNELPNAPDITATITADYTLPLGDEWLMTLHTDLYYQSEAWTRVFNTDGYDKIKAYNNINFAAIFTNEDSGWNVMAYVKNVLDRDSITGAFLNSDDTGLTTNIFLTEPRLYGVRVSKSWSGIPFWKQAGDGGKPHEPGAPYLFTIEVGGQNQKWNAPSEAIVPFADTFSDAVDPARAQSDDFNWSDGHEIRLTAQPAQSPWKLSAGVRYGRADTGKIKLRQSEIAGPTVCAVSEDRPPLPFAPQLLIIDARLNCDPDYVFEPGVYEIHYNGQDLYLELENKYRPENMVTPINRVASSGSRQEEHEIVDFAVGRDFGLGGLRADRSSLSAALRIAKFDSSVSGDMKGIPDFDVPVGLQGTTFHQYAASFNAQREFSGAGPTLSWDASSSLWGDDELGHVNIDWTLTGGALFGRQKTTITGTAGSEFTDDFGYPPYPDWWNRLPTVTQTPLNIAPRDKSVTVPVVDVSLGLSYEIRNIKFGAGYRWERYFNVLDGGFEEHESFDRTIEGPYFRVALGLGG